MSSKKAILAKLPAYQNGEVILETDQDVEDIMQGMKQWHKRFASDYDHIAADFTSNTPTNSLRKIFTFLHNNTYYNAESIEEQTVRSPAAIVATGNEIGIDCKNYSLFIGGVIDAINRSGVFDIPFVYRFASYDLFDRIPKHVFVVAYPGSEDEIWIDPCFDQFNDHSKQPVYFVDKKFSAMALKGIYGTEVNGLSDIWNNVFGSSGEGNVQVKYNEIKSLNPPYSNGMWNAEYLQGLIPGLRQQIAVANNNVANVCKTNACKQRNRAYAQAYEIVATEYEAYLDVLKKGGTPQVVNATNLSTGGDMIKQLLDLVTSSSVFPQSSPAGGGASPYDPPQKDDDKIDLGFVKLSVPEALIAGVGVYFIFKTLR